MSVYRLLLTIAEKWGAGFFVLLDPDKKPLETTVAAAESCEASGVDALLIGGSLLMSDGFNDFVRAVKEAVSIPVILFPGNGQQLSRHADALLFLSLLSGRNPEFLIGEQVRSAPRIHAMDLEAISTAYMLVESDLITSAEFMSNSKPLPRAKPEIAVAHALAAEYLGFKLIYLEAGSGADMSVPIEMIGMVRNTVSIPLIVGGGIRTPEEARSKVEAGASFVVVGNAFEDSETLGLLSEFEDAVHVQTA